MVQNNQHSSCVVKYGTDSLIRIVNHYLFFDGLFSGNFRRNKSQQICKFDLRFSLENEFHAAFVAKFKDFGITIVHGNDFLQLNAELSETETQTFFQDLCAFYLSLFAITIEFDSSNISEIEEEGGTIGNYAWHFHCHRDGSLHGHHAKLRLNPFSGEIYNSAANQLIRKVTPEQLQVIHDRLQNDAELGNIFTSQLIKN